MSKFLSCLFPLVLLTGCQTKRSSDDTKFYLDHRHQSETFDSRVQFLILHYTAVDEAESFRLLVTKDWPASAHYLVTETPELRNNKPVIFQLVDENKRAWHAGLSRWGTNAGLNSGSVGIEIVNYGFVEESTEESKINQFILDGYRLWQAEDKYWFYYTPEQIAAVIVLAQDIVARHNIDPENVLGHVDIAPLRKHDPGPLFPWKELYDAGVGAWYEQEVVNKYLAGRAPDMLVNSERLLKALAIYGYGLPEPPHGKVSEAEQKQHMENQRLVIRAFQMHFRPVNFTGVADAETEAIALALVERYKGKAAIRSVDSTLATLA